MTPAIHLQPGRERSLRLRHPWIFSGSVARVEGNPAPGESVDVRTSTGEFLARAAYSPQSQIRARVWSWEDEPIDPAFLKRRLETAINLRRALNLEGVTNAVRLVHGESDGLPGLVVDRYAHVVVVQFLSAGAEAWRETLVALLAELSGAACLFERSDADVRCLEGLEARCGILTGSLPATGVEIEEHGLRFRVDVQSGQKTGFYIDQRPNRQRVRRMVGGGRVLNCFCYTGAFSMAALAGGAERVVSVDSSADALEMGKVHAAMNGFQPEQVEWVEADVFAWLRTLRDRGEQFDAIILDPPKFAPTAAQVEKAARAYKDINLLALKLLKPGGLLFTFSCSGGVSADLFQKIVAGAALDAGIEARILERLAQGPDHPVALNFPEGAYLKGLVLQKA